MKYKVNAIFETETHFESKKVILTFFKRTHGQNVSFDCHIYLGKMLENWQFNVGGMAVIFLLDWLLNTLFKGYVPQGKIVINQQKTELVSLKGRVEHMINHQNVKGLRVHDGVQFSLFRFLSKHRLVIVEMAFKDGTTMKFEAVKWSTSEKGIDVEGMLFSLSD
ncbi:MAG: hypothetical protein HYZ43_04500 [Flavobacteriia bacterium]|nr:hypothetical protein [Flavobacteriia bacterium]